MNEFTDILFYVFLLLMPFFSGLYFEKEFITASIILILILVLLVIKIFRNKKIIERNTSVIKKILILFLLIFLSTNFTYLINNMFFEKTFELKLIMYGNIQLLEMSLFAIVCILKVLNTKDEEELKLEYKMQDLVVILSSCIMCILIFFKEFYREGRFEGTFYYANAMAMFFLITLVILYNYKVKKDSNIILKRIIKISLIFFILIALVLTNSRYTYILTALYILFELLKYIKQKNIVNSKNNIQENIKDKSIKNKNSKNENIKSENIKDNKSNELKPKAKYLIFFGIIGIAVFTVMVILSSAKFRNRFKIDTIIKDFELRASYLTEANGIIKEYPFGLGYEGYLNHQQIKENKYKLRLVHNMPYQIVLNYGFITLIIAIIYLTLYLKICYKKNKVFDYTNIALYLVLLHSLFDIGMSFIAIDNIIIMLVIRNIINDTWN